MFALARPAAAAVPDDVVSGGWCATPHASPSEATTRNGPRFGPGPKHRILYVMGTGGTYQTGADDSSQNISRIISGSPKSVPPFAGTAADWQEIMTCVRRIYAPYAIEVTDIEPPPDVDYVESVVGGTGADIGFNTGGGVLGVSSGGGPQCSVRERGVNFTFSAEFNISNEFICEIIAQESGHNYALDHALSCRDPMTYLGPCGQKSFQDSDVNCGESTPRSCSCGGSTQNSHQILLGIFGPADDVPPSVSISDPADGANVMPGFPITAVPADDIRVDRVEFFVDGVSIGVRSTEPYTLAAPLNLVIGARMVEVRAVDGDENTASASINLTLEPECFNNTECAAGMECINDRCLGGVGQPCELQDQCASGQCYFDPETLEQFCTMSCTTGGAACPSGFDCLDPGNFGAPKCLPGVDSTGCCSTTARSSGPAGGSVALLAIGLALVVIRRRRRSR